MPGAVAMVELLRTLLSRLLRLALPPLVATLLERLADAVPVPKPV